jgi:hypothetical protein
MTRLWPAIAFVLSASPVGKAAALGAFSGGLFGGLIGGGIGLAKRTDRWERVWPAP